MLIDETPLTNAILERNVGYANYQRDELVELARSLERRLRASQAKGQEQHGHETVASHANGNATAAEPSLHRTELGLVEELTTHDVLDDCAGLLRGHEAITLANNVIKAKNFIANVPITGRRK